MPYRRKKHKPLPPPPNDGYEYILVKTREGKFWRKKRGSLKTAKLNPTLKRSSQAMGVSSPAAKRIQNSLDEFIYRLNTGRFIARVSALLRKAYIKYGVLNFSEMKGFDFQPSYPLNAFLKPGVIISIKNGELSVKIAVYDRAVKQLNKIVTGFYFELIILSGDLNKTKPALRIENDISPLYPFSEWLKAECRLSVSLPTGKTPWMAMLKVSCEEGNEMAVHPRHYGMKVIEVGPAFNIGA